MGQEGQVTGFLVEPLRRIQVHRRLRHRIESTIAGVAATPARDHVQSDTQIRLARAMAWATAAVALILGSVGMLNTMLMSIFERTREIGILRRSAGGAPRVLALVLGEALVIALWARLVGMILAVVGPPAITIAPTARGFIDPNLPPRSCSSRWPWASVSACWAAFTPRPGRPLSNPPRPSAMSEPDHPTSGPVAPRPGPVKYYPDGHVQALRGVSLVISEAESVAVTGPSGCGKSTLLHILGGLDRPTEGDVFFRGKALSQLDIDAFRAQGGWLRLPVFLSDAHSDGIENIQIPMFEGTLARGRAHRRAEHLIEEVGLADRSTHRPAALRGQRQRVAIARALGQRPEYPPGR